MDLSVIIATMNRPVDLALALGSVASQTKLPDEVVIVDQSRDELSAEVAKSVNERGPLKGRVRYVRQDVPSLVAARNRGLASTHGEFVSFIDDDVVLLPDYYRRVMMAFAADRDVGAIGGSVLNSVLSGMKWRLRQVLSYIFMINSWNGRMTPSGFGYPIYHRPITRRTRVDMLHGCNMTVRRSAVAGPWFDEWFTGYSFREDAEFSYRVSRSSTVVMIPEAQLIHIESPAGRLPSVESKRMEIRNLAFVWRKHRGEGVLARALFRYSLRGLIVLDWLGTLDGDANKRARYETALKAMHDLKV